MSTILYIYCYYFIIKYDISCFRDAATDLFTCNISHCIIIITVTINTDKYYFIYNYYYYFITEYIFIHIVDI